MKRQLVYDWPMRIFHWFFVLFFLTAFIIAKTTDDETLTFTFHMLAGLSLGFLVLMRLVWGFVGSHHAQFTNWPLNISQLKEYFKEMKSQTSKYYAGHNPASSWAGLGMIILSLVVVVTGLLMIFRINKRFFEDVHAWVVYVWLALAVAHIAGVVMHTIRKKDMIGLSMFDGKKNFVSDKDAISSSHAAVGVVFLVLLFGFIGYLRTSYDLETKKLNVFGQELSLGKKPRPQTQPKDD